MNKYCAFLRKNVQISTVPGYFNVCSEGLPLKGSTCSNHLCAYHNVRLMSIMLLLKDAGRPLPLPQEFTGVAQSEFGALDFTEIDPTDCVSVDKVRQCSFCGMPVVLGGPVALLSVEAVCGLLKQVGIFKFAIPQPAVDPAGRFRWTTCSSCGANLLASLQGKLARHTKKWWQFWK